MDIVYQALFRYEKEREELLLTRILPDGSQETSPVDPGDIQWAEEAYRDFRWNQSPGLLEQIGKRLFDLLNGDRQKLLQALNEADSRGKPLQVHIRSEGPPSKWPFDLLYYKGFLVPSRAQLVRLVSDRGCKGIPKPKDHPLKVLFMACSPEGISPVLRFEKEENVIYEVSNDYPIDIDVEDTGTLYGLGECLVRNEYDIFHLSGHMDISEEGVPLFFMEDEEGYPVKVTPARLWDKLKLNPPHLFFLSGCSIGQTPGHEAAFSFAHYLVAHYSSAALGWGLPVSDTDTSFVTERIYSELSMGKDILHAVHATRGELFARQRCEWALFPLFSDGTPVNIPLVLRGQKSSPRKRDIQYTYLRNSQVKVLTKGFIGRRRMIQKGLRCLKKEDEKIGLLLHGTYGLGKGCLAGRFCERFRDHTLIIVQGPLSEVTHTEALKDAFLLAADKRGQRILKEEIEWPDKIRMLCSTSFRERPYLILMDDFDKNLAGNKEGRPEVSCKAAPILEALLRYLPYTNKMSRLIITSRYPFSFMSGGINLIDDSLESIGLTSLRSADKWKKVSGLDQISVYPDPVMRKQIIEAGRGNPRLMETLNILLKETKDLDIPSLLFEMKGKGEEFVHDLILRRILEGQKEGFHRLLRRCAVYRLPVSYKGIGLVCEGIKDWKSHIKQAVYLSLMEQNKGQREAFLYWVSPGLRKDIFEELQKEERKQCHEAALSYYQVALSEAESYSPIMALELIEHALQAGIDNLAIEAGGKLLSYLHETLSYKEALFHGESILSRISLKKRDEKFAPFLFQLGCIYHDTGEEKKAVECYKQALSIDKKVFKDTYPGVTSDLNNLGEAWRTLGEHKKAIEYYEQGLSIDKKLFGDAHPRVAKDLNNLGEAWRALGEHKKAIEYYEQGLSIDKKLFGDAHPSVAKDLNNLGEAWNVLREHEKAIEYYEQALFVDKKAFGDKHPKVAIRLNNLGEAWHALQEHKKAIEYYEQALSINKKAFGNTHPDVGIRLNNLGEAWRALGEPKKAAEHFEQAYDIFLEFYGDEHPQSRIVKEWLDSLKDENN